MTIGILECGAVPARLQAQFGRYGDMVAALLGPGRPVQRFDVTQGALPPGPAACSAYVLTGSPAGVYDGLPWIAPLLRFLQQARGQAKLVGICFGHQAMAEAFGGAVVKSPKGWSIGLHRYETLNHAPWMDAAPFVDVPASHQDQVVACPPGARVIAASGFTPYAGLDYGDAASFQFHPEFSAAFGAALIEGRRDLFGDLAGPALESYRARNDCARVAGWIGRFLDGAAA